MTKYPIIFAAVLAFAVSPLLAADPFVEYLAGVELLRSSRNMSDEERAAGYRRLVEITGITTQRARIRIEAYRNKPEQWRNVHTRILNLLKEPDSDKE